MLLSDYHVNEQLNYLWIILQLQKHYHLSEINETLRPVQKLNDELDVAYQPVLEHFLIEEWLYILYGK
jgi:hypothetical protein